MEKSATHDFFQEVFKTFAKDIFRYLYVRLASNETAEDLTSEVFVKFWNVLLRKEHVRHPRALLYTIAHGLVVDEYRKRKKKTIRFDTVDVSALLHHDDTELKLIRAEKVSELLTHIGKLKSEYQEILLLYYIEEMPVPEIATILRKKQGTIRVLVHRALTALRALYEKK